MDVANLVLKVDSKGVVTASKNLDGLEKQSNQAEKSTNKLSKASESLSRVLASAGGVAAGLTAVATAAGLFVANASAQEKSMKNMATLAGMGAVEFQNYAYAAESVGISQEKLADISKDVQDKLGDFVATGGGAFIDFFEQVAPKVGITAQSLQGLAGPDVLVAVKKAMDDANVSAEEQVFYLEAIASDATLLNPLLADSGKALYAMAKEADALGLALNEVDSKNLLEAAETTRQMKAVFSSASRELSAKLAPAFVAVGDTATEVMRFISDGWDNVDLTVIAIIDGMVSGWIHVKYRAEEVALTMTSVFAVAGDQILEAWAEMLDGMASGLDSMSFTITNPFGDDFTVGFESASESIRKHADNIRDASTAEEDYTEASARLVDEKKRELEAHESIIGAMVDEVNSRGAVVETLEKTTASTNKQIEAEEKQAKAIRITTDERYESLQIVKEHAKEAEEALQKELEAAERLAMDKANAARNMYSDMKGQAENNFKLQVALLDAEFAAYDKLIDDKVALGEWYKQKHEELEKEKTLATGSFFDGIKVGYERMIKDQKTWAEVGLEVFNTFANEAESALSSNLFDIIHGDFDNLGDAWSSLWDTMLKVMTDKIAEMAVSWAAAEVADVASSFIFHDGTMNAGGDYNGQALLHDEIPAVLQKGEIVIPREQSDRIRDALNGDTSIDQSTVSSTFDSVADALGADLTTQEGIDQTGGFLSGFLENFGEELGRDGLLGGIGIATGISTEATLDAITSPANIAQNATNAALDAVMDTMGIDPTAQTAGKLGGALAGLLGALSAPVAAIAALAVAVGVDGLMDVADMRDMESVRDQFQTARTKQAEEFGLPSAVAEVFGHFAGNVDFAAMEAQVEAAHGGPEGVEDLADPIGYDIDYGTEFDNTPGGYGGDLSGTEAETSGSLDTFDGDMGNIGDDPGDMAARYGGIFSGPDQGYPIELHGTEAVIPLRDGSVPVEIKGGRDGDNSALIEEIRLLRADIMTGNFQIAKNTNETRKILRRIEGDGIETRAA